MRTAHLASDLLKSYKRKAIKIAFPPVPNCEAHPPDTV